METNVNFAAPLGAVAFLGTAVLLTAVAILLIFLLATRKFGKARVVTIALVIVGGVYGGLLLLFAATSKDKVLARGGEKHFCEIDCHLAYSVIDTKQFKTIGGPANPVTAAGMFTAVTIKTRFDEHTISPKRGNAELYPNSRVLTIIDDQGRRFAPSAEGQRANEAAGSAGTSLTTPLRPGEYYTTTVVFDLPADARNPTLLINEGEWVTHLVIGHENSPLHKKTRFQL
jgi:hypothetical protein